MNSPNPSEVTETRVADMKVARFRRPIPVTIALVFFWLLLTTAALGAIGQLRRPSIRIDFFEWSYRIYIVGIALVPAFFLVKIAQARNWSRFALLILYTLNLLFRIHLLLHDAEFNPRVAAWLLLTALIDAISFILLFLPMSNRWFTWDPPMPNELSNSISSGPDFRRD